MIGIRIDCEICKNLIKDNNFYRCRAFPDGIPEVILDGIQSHTEPYPGDGGILFEPIEGATNDPQN